MPTALLPHTLNVLEEYGLVAATTATNPIRFPVVKFGPGVGIEETTTNLVTNPRLGTASTNWGAPFVGTDVGTRVTDMGPYGQTAWKVNRPIANADSRVSRYTHNLAATGTYVASIYVWVEASLLGAGTMRLDVSPSGSLSAETDLATSTTTGRWVRLATQFTASATGNLFFDVQCAVSTGIGNMWATGLQIELKSYATSYTDGSLGTGYAWTGTAHASTSTRTAGRINHTLGTAITQRTVTVAGWMRLEHSIGSGPSARVFADLYDGTINERATLFINGTNLAARKTAAAVSVAANSTVTSAVAGDLIFAAYTFDGATVKSYASINGGTVVAGSTASTTIPAAGTAVELGRSAAAGGEANGGLEQLLIYNTALTSAEIDALAAATDPTDFDDDSRILFAAATPLVEGQTDGLTNSGTGYYRTTRTVDGRIDRITAYEATHAVDTATHKITVPAGSGIGEGEYVQFASGRQSRTRWLVKELFTPTGVYDELYVTAG